MLGTPALASVVGPLDGPDDLLGEGGEDRRCRARVNVLLGKDVLAAVGVHSARKLGGIDAKLAGKALGRLGGGAVGVKGDAGRGAALDLVELLGCKGNVMDVGNEPSRRLVCLHLAVS